MVFVELVFWKFHRLWDLYIFKTNLQPTVNFSFHLELIEECNMIARQAIFFFFKKTTNICTYLSVKMKILYSVLCMKSESESRSVVSSPLRPNGL